MFAEKQKLVSDLEAYGPAGSQPVLPPAEAIPEVKAPEEVTAEAEASDSPVEA
jgi:hypothetical protein